MTLLKRVLASFLVVGLGWFTVTGHATTESKSPEDAAKPSFEAVDSNSDDVITPSEAEGTWLASVFSDVDANQDGLINRNEYESALS